MIKFISKYYLKFPPLVRRGINFSLKGYFSYVGIDYLEHISDENILHSLDELNENLFV